MGGTADWAYDSLTGPGYAVGHLAVRKGDGEAHPVRRELGRRDCLDLGRSDFLYAAILAEGLVNRVPNEKELHGVFPPDQLARRHPQHAQSNSGPHEQPAH